jgi:hypothetical protein
LLSEQQKASSIEAMRSLRGPRRGPDPLKSASRNPPADCDCQQISPVAKVPDPTRAFPLLFVCHPRSSFTILRSDQKSPEAWPETL